MLDILRTRIALGHRTAPLPRAGEVVLPEGARGLPTLSNDPCPPGCNACGSSCPTGALSLTAEGPSIDLGTCLFCPECTRVCPAGTFRFSREHRLASRSREALVLGPGTRSPAVTPMARELRKLFGRSLKLRQVSAGGCNGCEAELVVTGTLVFDLGRFGVQFVASPRHADGLVVTGPVTENMRLALEKTYAALPAPKLVIACGACAIGGGPFRGSPRAHDGVGDLLPVDLWIPGCPPHPWTIADGILRFMGIDK